MINMTQVDINAVTDAMVRQLKETQTEYKSRWDQMAAWNQCVCTLCNLRDAGFIPDSIVNDFCEKYGNDLDNIK